MQYSAEHEGEKTTYNVHQFHFYNIQVIFKKKTVNITDDVMLSSAYFYIHYCEEHVVSRDEGDAKRRIFPTAFKDEL